MTDKVTKMSEREAKWAVERMEIERMFYGPVPEEALLFEQITQNNSIGSDSWNTF